MPGLSGLQVQQRLNERGDELPVIFMTGHGDVPMAVAALKAGAAIASGRDEPFYRAKQQSADYAIRQWLPVGRAQLAVIDAGMASLAAFDAAAH